MQQVCKLALILLKNAAVVWLAHTLTTIQGRDLHGKESRKEGIEKSGN